MSEPQQSGSLLAAALSYAGRGWHVFPCHLDKSPATSHGVKNASTDPAVIRRWWAARPDASIGLACGPSGLVVIDIDSGKGGFDSWQTLRATHGINDETLTSVTGGGGRHLIYCAPQGFQGRNSAGKLGTGLDVRANGGYIIAPPSGHPSGGIYTWDLSHPDPIPLPDSLRALLERIGASPAAVRTTPGLAISERGYGAAALRLELARLDRTVPGTRNDALNAAAFSLGQLVASGAIERGEVERQLLSGALAIELSEREARATIRSGLDAGARTPRAIPEPRGRPHQQPPGTQHAGTVAQQACPAEHRAVTSTDLLDFLQSAGYVFRLNACDDSIEVSGERMTDLLRSEIRCKLRDAGYGKYLAAAEDAYLADAKQRAYHPVREYLRDLIWHGEPAIAQLTACFSDMHGVFPTYLRKWLIGATARAFTGCQNTMLVLDGAQGLGKSEFVRWLCPLPELFADSSINPDDKDDRLKAMRTWVWEVKELGATIRRADVESLKSFLTCNAFSVRPAYGRYEVRKPGLASFIGTVNQSAGIFNDSTGSRRFMTTTLTSINWTYRAHVDLHQVWAEAYAAYLAGEAWSFSPDEAARAQQINDEYNVADAVEDLLRKHFHIAPANRNKWTRTADILTALQDQGLRGTTKALSMDLSATMRRLKCEKKRQQNEWGYFGVWPR